MPNKANQSMKKADLVIIGGSAAGATAEDVTVFQAGTHPALTGSPVVYQIVTAAEHALVKLS